MAKWIQYLGQGVCYCAFMLLLGYFTDSPKYTHLESDQATIKLGIRHPGKIIGECTPLTEAEIDALAANMKVVESCPRERSPLRIEVALDDEVIYRDEIPPSGLHRDGIATMYQRFSVPAGEHRLQVKMNDDVAVENYNYNYDKQLVLEPAQVMVIQYVDGFIVK
jgi:hypothetical protein